MPGMTRPKAGWPLVPVASLVGLATFNIILDGEGDEPQRMIGGSTDTVLVARGEPEQSGESPLRVGDPAGGGIDMSRALWDTETESLGRHIDRFTQMEDAGERVEALATLWRAAADAQDPSAALMALAAATQDPDPAASDLAQRALDDLERMAAERELARAQAEAAVRDHSLADTAGEDPDGAGFADVRAGFDTAPADPTEVLRGLEKRVAAFEEATPEHRTEALLDVWRYATDTRVPEPALDFMENVVLAELGSDLGKRARRALIDLERQWNQLAEEESAALSASASIERSTQRSGEPSTDQASLRAAQAAMAVAAEQARARADRLERLAALLRSDDDQVEHAKVINLIGLQARDDTTTSLLIEGTASPSTGARHESVRNLWFAAADGHDDGRITDALERAAKDPDARVREIATRALADLEKLEVTRTR
ncbi:MAG: hypothetical protein ACR2RL_01035 [Gammaproteobacteria bacterium]